MELSEGDENIKFKKYTEKALNQIKAIISDLNKKVKKLK
jgi:hypothetical protein